MVLYFSHIFWCANKGRFAAFALVSLQSWQVPGNKSWTLSWLKLHTVSVLLVAEIFYWWQRARQEDQSLNSVLFVGLTARLKIPFLLSNTEEWMSYGSEKHGSQYGHFLWKVPFQNWTGSSKQAGWARFTREGKMPCLLQNWLVLTAMSCRRHHWWRLWGDEDGTGCSQEEEGGTVGGFLS